MFGVSDCLCSRIEGTVTEGRRLEDPGKLDKLLVLDGVVELIVKTNVNSQKQKSDKVPTVRTEANQE